MSVSATELILCVCVCVYVCELYRVMNNQSRINGRVEDYRWKYLDWGIRD